MGNFWVFPTVAFSERYVITAGRELSDRVFLVETAQLVKLHPEGSICIL